jgi:hypothetical protein
MSKALRERAGYKAFAKIAMLKIEVKDLKRDLRDERWGPITEAEVLLLLNGTEKELKVWNYIKNLIDKSEE